MMVRIRSITKKLNCKIIKTRSPKKTLTILTKWQVVMTQIKMKGSSI
jgi:hypothetical protein